MSIKASSRPDTGKGWVSSKIGPNLVPMWPGIAWGWNSQCNCTWAISGGLYQVKVQNFMCPVHPQNCGNRLDPLKPRFAGLMILSPSVDRERFRKNRGGDPCTPSTPSGSSS